MPRIYHLVPRPVWEKAPPGPYGDPSLQAEGFIHCSHPQQVARVANLFFAECPELLVLCIDAAHPSLLVRDEDIGTGERFPHVYGLVDRAAILEVRPLRRGEDGRWVFSETDENQ